MGIMIRFEFPKNALGSSEVVQLKIRGAISGMLFDCLDDALVGYDP